MEITREVMTAKEALKERYWNIPAPGKSNCSRYLKR
jgi:hypothetical protein